MCLAWICLGPVALAEWGPEVPESEMDWLDADTREAPNPEGGMILPRQTQALPERSDRGLKSTGIAEAAASQPAGALAGVVVYCGAGHGFGANTAEDAWVTERPLLYALNEDAGNIDQLNRFAELAWKAGATVVPFRPVGYQTNEVVLDNVDTTLTAAGQVTFSGTWANTANTTLYYGTTGEVGYRYAAVDTGGTTSRAEYRPVLPVEGLYPVYTWVRHGSDRANQLYRVVHSGGTTEIRVDHSQVGRGWVWLGTYYFEAGTNGSVVISNYDPDGAGEVVIADAIRFGNGMGDVSRGAAGVSGFSQELESSRFWTLKSMGVGMPTSLYDIDKFNDYDDNIGQPARMAANMCRTNGWERWRRLYVGFHSNAGGGRGVVGLGDSRLATNTPYADFYQGQTNLAMSMARRVHTNMTEAVAGGVIPSWSSTFRSTTWNYTYGEIYNSSVYKLMDTTILEVAFHDDADDAAVLKMPAGREWIARSTVQGIVDHLSAFYPASTVPSAYAPDAPVSMQAFQTGSGEVTLNWTMAAMNAASGDAPTGFIITSSENGKGFGNPVSVPGGAVRSHTLTGLTEGAAIFFRVCATNAGGESAYSPVAGVRVTTGGAGADVLLVDGFTRNSSSLAPLRYVPNAIVYGSLTLVRPRMINSFDYVKEHGLALAAAGETFDSTDAAGLSLSVLTNYSKVVWILGEESTVDETFSTAEQSVVESYLNGGGCLMVSGAEIGWDLSVKGSDSDELFLTNVLRTAYITDSSGTGRVTGGNGGLLDGISLSFNYTNLLNDIYAANYPDVLDAGNGATVAAVYGTSPAGTSGAIIQYSNETYRTVLMGFPFETILEESNRTAVMTRVMEFFNEGLTPTNSVTLIDEPFDAAPTAPAGWSFSGISSYSGSSYAGRAIPSVKFDSDGDSITSPVFSGGTNLQFWMRGVPASGTVATGTFVVAQFAGGGWSTLETLTNPSKTGTVYSVDIPGSVTQLRFTWNKTYGNIALDDVIVNGVGDGGAADSDGDGLPDDWEDDHFGGPTNAVPTVDSDGDGPDNYSEYIAGTGPNQFNSVLAVDSMLANTNTSTLVFRWPSVTGRVYSLWMATNAVSSYTQHIGGIAATVPTNAYTNAAPAAAGTYYYGVRVSWPDAP